MNKVSTTMTHYANRSIRQRRQMHDPDALRKAAFKKDAMLAEGKVLSEVLGTQDFQKIMKYVAENSTYIRTSGEHIQVVWAPHIIVCIHRLLAKELRKEHHANWLGVWTEPLTHPKETVIRNMERKMRLREKMQSMREINFELQIDDANSIRQITRDLNIVDAS